MRLLSILFCNILCVDHGRVKKLEYFLTSILIVFSLPLNVVAVIVLIKHSLQIESLF